MRAVWTAPGNSILVGAEELLPIAGAAGAAQGQLALELETLRYALEVTSHASATANAACDAYCAHLARRTATLESAAQGLGASLEAFELRRGLLSEALPAPGLEALHQELLAIVDASGALLRELAERLEREELHQVRAAAQAPTLALLDRWCAWALAVDAVLRARLRCFQGRAMVVTGSPLRRFEAFFRGERRGFRALPASMVPGN